MNHTFNLFEFLKKNDDNVEIFTSKGTMDIDSFSDKIKELLSKAWGEGWGTFTHEEPTDTNVESVEMPIITYDTYNRRRSESHRSKEPILFQKERDPDDPNSIILVYRMWYDVKLDFKIFHETNREARQIMSEFEDFLFVYKGYFQELGISDIIFDEELPPEVIARYGKTIPTRTLRYLVRIERVTTIRSTTIKSLNEQVKRPSTGVGTIPDALYDGSILNHYQEQFRPSDEKGGL